MERLDKFLSARSGMSRKEAQKSIKNGEVTVRASVDPDAVWHTLRQSVETMDGKPMMYAKNDFHIRFYDAAGYFADDSRPFTDYSVSREVVPVGELQATQTFGKVAENDVRWYTVNVEAGDTLAFQSSQASSIQLFSPSGKELYAASGGG